MTDPEWWRHGVVYQIYPRSFADTNGDGLGDLQGIIDHLDHLAGAEGSLGVDAIWLSPIYPSPALDVGYDVADHTGVDPIFGSMADFDRLVAEAHRRGLKVILDLVLNHTSDQNAWFVDSRRSRDNAHADWYLWRDPAGVDGRGRPLPPNNWLSWFGGSAWQWEPAREQFYLHTFLAEQPDVNWRSPGLREAQFEVARGWLARGVDGFRLDVFNTLLKSESFASNPVRTRLSRNPWDRQEHVNDKDQPEFADLLREFRAVVDEAPGRMTVGELFASQLERAVEYTSGHHLVFDFGLLMTSWSSAALGAEIDRREAAYGPDRWPAVVLSNHDQSRHVTRFAKTLGLRDPANLDHVAKAAAVLLLTLRGTPFLYYGEEIGLPDVAVPKPEIVDPPAKRASLFFPWWNRDQCRSPLPWTGGPNGGFTTGRPWLRMIPDSETRNVAAQAGTPGSVFETYRALLALRRRSRALHAGTFKPIDPVAHDVLAWTRQADDEIVLVAINVGLKPRRIVLPPGDWRPLFDTEPEPLTGAVTGGLGGGLVLDGLQAVILAPAGVAAG